VKLRNPQGDTPERNWIGDWSHKSEKWTPKLRETLAYDNDSEQLGIIFMSYEDFQHYFQRCTICKIPSKAWEHATTSLELPRNAPPMKGVVVEVPAPEEGGDEAVECFIVLHQAEKRLRYGPLFKGSFEPMADIGLVVLPLDSSSTAAGAWRLPRAAAVGRIRARPTVPVECSLKPGKYLVVPLSSHTGHNRHVEIVCDSSRLVTLKAQKLEPEQLRHAWAAYALHRDPHEALSTIQRKTIKGGELVMAQGAGTAVVVVAVNTSEDFLYSDLRLQGDGLRLSRKENHTQDCLKAGYAQVVQILLPEAPGQLSMWMPIPSIEITPVPPYNQRHKPAVNEEKAMGMLHMPFSISGIDMPPLPDLPRGIGKPLGDMPCAPLSQRVSPGAVFSQRSMMVSM